MKSRNLYLTALACAAIALPNVAAAQEEVISETQVQVTCDPTTHYTSNWRDNWFIQIGAGINQPMVERGVGVESKLNRVDKKKMTVAYNFGFGRWFSPYFAFRFNAIGGALHWDNPTLDQQPTNGWTHAKHVNVNLEMMWDMCNSLGGVNPNRPVSVIPFIGLGGDYTWRIKDSNGDPAPGSWIGGTGEKGVKTESWTLPVTAGIDFRFRLCKYVDFFAEARATFYGDNWNNCSYGKPIESNVAVLGGFSFNIGGRNWNSFNECDYMTQLADAMAKNAQLADALALCNNQVANLQSQLPCPEAQTVEKDCVNAPLMTTVRFTINSSTIMPTEEVNVYNMAEWLKANPNEKVTIVGYADKDTGTSEYNMKLSERRANAVADALVNTYGISRDRLNIRFDGSDVQPYSTNDWNRIVIFTQK
ncbi:putative uncharacterized protein [Prevotella sp. CAG:485]|nr:putative uncharacterized protein [Prevotella sp. CAG:485]